MDLVFTKGAGKTDTLAMRHADGRVETIDAPRQRIVPHDMVHYAVESVVAARGFLGRVANGEAADVSMQGAAESDGVERLVEAIQGDAWSGGTTPAADVLALYAVTCAARACPPLAIDLATIDAIRATMAELTARWDAVPVGGTMALSL